MSEYSQDIIPAGHVYIKDSVLKKGNILGVSGNKGEWAAKLNISRQGEYIFFAGCAYQFMHYGEGMMQAAKDMNKLGFGMNKAMNVSKVFNKVGVDLPGMVGKIVTFGKEDPYVRTLISAVNVLKKLDINFGYLGDEEPCCGSPMYYAGFVDDYIKNAESTNEAFKSRRIKKLIGIMPACTASLKNSYPKYVPGYDIEVKHFLEVVADKLRETTIKPRLSEHISVTYHDPCMLSRYLDIFEEPREILSRIDGVELHEPEPDQRGKWSTCCGGGGGMEACAPELAERLAVKRVNELLATGANTIVTSCPACESQLTKGIKKLNANVKVVDLADLLDRALQEK